MRTIIGRHVGRRPPRRPSPLPGTGVVVGRAPGVDPLHGVEHLSIFFGNVRVPLDHRLGDEDRGFAQVMQGHDRGIMAQRRRDVLGFQTGGGTARIMKAIVARTRAGRQAVPA